MSACWRLRMMSRSRVVTAAQFPAMLHQVLTVLSHGPAFLSTIMRRSLESDSLHDQRGTTSQGHNIIGLETLVGDIETLVTELRAILQTTCFCHDIVCPAVDGNSSSVMFRTSDKCMPRGLRTSIRHEQLIDDILEL